MTASSEPPVAPAKNLMDRFIDGIELIAAAFVGIVAVNTFIAVFMRKFFGLTIPDYYDFGRLLLGILIFWGIAATSYRGTHITVDLVWANVAPKYQRWSDLGAAVRRHHADHHLV
jgi:TRAP-type C4-dicarboxylate transport system permease small subunit